MMIGLGTIINAAAIVAGGICGKLFGRFMPQRIQDTLNAACGTAVLFIGIAGAMEGMIALQDGKMVSGQAMLVVLSLAIGAFLGELANIEELMERFGSWLKIKTGNSRETKFVDGFVTASLTVCIGAMAIVGSIRDGIFGDYSILATKAVLDFVIILVMTCSMGKGCLFSAIPVACFQGSITLLARLIKPLMTEAALFHLSLVGSILIFCVGVNLVWGKKIRVANLLPAILIAVLMSYLPISL